MPKPRKSTHSRTPPTPSEDHDAIDAWMRSVMPDLQPVVRHLDTMIRDTIAGLQYAIKWKKAYYGLPKLGWIIEMVAYDVSVNLVFHGGADFDEPPPLGDTGRSRYVKVTTLDEGQRPELGRWVEQAARVPGWR